MLYLFFLIINLYFLINAVIAKVFSPRTHTNEANAEIETQPVTIKAKIKNYDLIHVKVNFLFHLPFKSKFEPLKFLYII